MAMHSTDSGLDGLAREARNQRKVGDLVLDDEAIAAGLVAFDEWTASWKQRRPTQDRRTKAMMSSDRTEGMRLAFNAILQKAKVR